MSRTPKRTQLYWSFLVFLPRPRLSCSSCARKWHLTKVFRWSANSDLPSRAFLIPQFHSTQLQAHDHQDYRGWSHIGTPALAPLSRISWNLHRPHDRRVNSRQSGLRQIINSKPACSSRLVKSSCYPDAASPYNEYEWSVYKLVQNDVLPESLSSTL
jgi:hypothetical protein